MQFEEKIVVVAPADVVYSVYQNIAGWPDWDSDVLSSELNGPFETGSKGKLKPKQGPETKFQLIEVTKNQSFTVECKLPLCKMHFVHELIPTDQNTEVTNKIIFSGLLSPLFSRLIGKEIKDTVPASLRGLKEHIENKVSGLA